MSCTRHVNSANCRAWTKTMAECRPDVSPEPIGVGLDGRWPRPVRFASTADSKQRCLWPRDTRSAKPHDTCELRGSACGAGSSAICRSVMFTLWSIAPEAAGHGEPSGLRPSDWRQRWRVTRSTAATWPRHGRCRCWRTTWPNTTASRSANTRCGDACTRRAGAGSVRATSTRSGRLMWHRKIYGQPDLCKADKVVM